MHRSSTKETNVSWVRLERKMAACSNSCGSKEHQISNDCSSSANDAEERDHPKIVDLQTANEAVVLNNLSLGKHGTEGMSACSESSVAAIPGLQMRQNMEMLSKAEQRRLLKEDEYIAVVVSGLWQYEDVRDN